MQISTPGKLQLTGTLEANGGGGGYAHASVLAQAGPGAGGSGGIIELHASTIEITSNAVIMAKGGRGGKLSTEAQSVSCGADGSIGYLTLRADEYRDFPLSIHSRYCRGAATLPDCVGPRPGRTESISYNFRITLHQIHGRISEFRMLPRRKQP